MLAFVAGAVLAGAIAVALVLLDVGGSEEEGQAGPAPRVVIREDQPEAPPDVGFPEFASKNTTRIAGADAVTNSVGAVLAAFPSRGGVPGPDAVAMVAEEDWASGIAASVLVSDPIRVPLLVGTREEVPDLVLDALVSLAPPGSSATEDVQLFQIGDVAAPTGLRTRQVTPGNPAEVAARVEALRQRLTDANPKHIVLASSDDPAFAMPAAAWAARSGDPVLFVQRDSVPQATLNVLERYEDVPVFLLGPESVVSDTVVDDLEDAGITVERVGGEEPVTNAIAFARYVGVADFGWNITDPGHGLVFANAGRPADAGASSVLSASGTWGPMLLLESAEELPPALEGYLLDIKPGYVDDPTRAVYNQGWVIGDSGAISVDVQAQIDDLLELAQVQSGSGGAPELGPAPGTPEDIPDADQP